MQPPKVRRSPSLNRVVTELADWKMTNDWTRQFGDIIYNCDISNIARRNKPENSKHQTMCILFYMATQSDFATNSFVRIEDVETLAASSVCGSWIWGVVVGAVLRYSPLNHQSSRIDRCHVSIVFSNLWAVNDVFSLRQIFSADFIAVSDLRQKWWVAQNWCRTLLHHWCKHGNPATHQPHMWTCQ